MRTKLLLSTLGLLLVTLIPARAQRVDIGLMAGGSYYYGDVVNELELGAIRYSFGGFIRYRLTERWALKGFGGLAHIVGDDKNSSSSWQKARNFRFSNDIIEGSLQAEYNLVEDRNKGRKFKNKLIPYVFGGIGMIYFKPKTDLLGGNQSLQPLRLSGVNYEQTAITVPFGIGVRYYVTRTFSIGAELGIRYTSTSYLDDIGGTDKYQNPENTPVPAATRAIYQLQTGNKNPGDPRGKMGLGKFRVNDMYVIGGITIAYTISKGGGGGYGGGKAVRCPRFY